MKTDKRLFPLYVDLSTETVVVCGGGTIASRRIHTLLEFVKDIIVISPEILPELKEMADQGILRWFKKSYETSDLHYADIVLAATDHAEVNHEIYRSCKIFGIPVNNGSDKNECDFQFPGIILQDEVVIAFNSGGRNYKKTREIREKVQAFLNSSEEEK